MSDRPVQILIAEWIPSLNKGELAILLGMLETFNTLGEHEVTAFSFMPAIDSERYPPSVKVCDVSKSLHLGSTIFDGSRTSFLRALFLSITLHVLFMILWILFRNRAIRIMRGNLWKHYVEADVILICHDGVSCALGFVLPFYPVYIYHIVSKDYTNTLWVCFVYLIQIVMHLLFLGISTLLYHY